MIRFGEYFPTLVETFKQQGILSDVFNILVTVSLPLLACLLAFIFWPLWVTYVRAQQVFKMKYSVLELKLPKDTFKSPKAMDLLLHAFHNTSDGNWIKQFWLGETRPWYSLEICSFEGKVKFFIWCESSRKVGAMGALYAQFPGIEVTEVPDYALTVDYDPKTMKTWSGEFILTKPDPYPIKTYVDYGLDKDPKEEFKVDPLVPGIEFLGNIGPNQQIWIQYLIRAHKDEQKKPGHLFKKTDAWKDEAVELMDEIMKRNPKTKVAGEKDPETGRVVPPTLNDAEKEVVAALSRSITKLAFDVGVRCLYIAKKESFDTPFGMGGCISFFKNFNTEHLNGFKPNSSKWTPSLDAPYKDFMDYRRNKYSNMGLLAYKMRSFFYPPFDDTPMVLNTEELATMFHFPGSVSATPGLERVPSKKGEAPANLPI